MIIVLMFPAALVFIGAVGLYSASRSVRLHEPVNMVPSAEIVQALKNREKQ